MLDVLSYPVSLLFWLWHSAFAFLVGGANVFGWGLAIAFLVFTLRALLLRPAIGQARFAERMREIAPRLTALKEKYGTDKERYAVELQKLLGEHQVNPVTGYLPVLVQIPVFLGLNHVLRALTSLPVGDTYAFSAADVRSFLAAKVFDVHLGDAILDLSGPMLWHVAPVAVPLMLLAAAATFLTTRLSTTAAASSGLGRALGYLLPAGVLVFGAFLPVGLLVYWVSNNLWTLGQQYLLLRRGKPAAVNERR